jgi:hypothetical protein
MIDVDGAVFQRHLFPLVSSSTCWLVYPRFRESGDTTQDCLAHQYKSAAREVPGRDKPPVTNKNLPEEVVDGTERVDATGGTPDGERARSSAACKEVVPDIERRVAVVKIG